MVLFRSSWADRHGTHVRAHHKGEYDATAIYCPDQRACYYVRNDEVEGSTIILRTHPSRNGQRARIRLASNYTDPMRIFRA